MCAGLIGYRALRMCGDAPRLGLYGFGAAAHILIQVARAQGREVLAFTRPGDDEAQAWGALGSYGPPEGLGTKPALMRVAAVHDADEIADANAADADAAMLSPVFPTLTHPGARPLGPERFHSLAALADMPVIGLLIE